MSETKFWYHYRLLAPTREQYKDDDSQVIVRVPARLGDRSQVEVALIGPSNAPETIRVRLEHPTGHFSDVQRKAIVALSLHMLTTLRLTSDHDAEFATYSNQHLAVLTPADAQGKPTLNMQIEAIFAQRRAVNEADIRNTFVGTLPHRALFDLLADSQRAANPLQYQYLSLFKILEHEFRVKSRWIGLKEFFAAHDEEFRRMDCGPGSLHRAVHELRDKTAHIKVGKLDQPGITGVDSRDAERITKLMPLLHRIVMDHLTAKYHLARRP